MKYIMFRHKFGEGVVQDIPVIFPNQLIHKFMAKRLVHALSFDHNIRAEVVSAGSINAEGVCYGESETLGVKSRPQDTEIIRHYDFTGGIAALCDGGGLDQLAGTFRHGQ